MDNPTLVNFDQLTPYQKTSFYYSFVAKPDVKIMSWAQFNQDHSLDANANEVFVIHGYDYIARIYLQPSNIAGLPGMRVMFDVPDGVTLTESMYYQVLCQFASLRHNSDAIWFVTRDIKLHRYLDGQFFTRGKYTWAPGPQIDIQGERSYFHWRKHQCWNCRINFCYYPKMTQEVRSKLIPVTDNMIHAVKYPYVVIDNPDVYLKYLDEITPTERTQLLSITGDKAVMSTVGDGSTWNNDKLQELIKYSKQDRQLPCLQRQYQHYVIYTVKDGVVGYIGIHPLLQRSEIRVFVGKQFQGHKYATTAYRIVMNVYSQEIYPQGGILWASISPDNISSLKIMTSIGWQPHFDVEIMVSSSSRPKLFKSFYWIANPCQIPYPTYQQYGLKIDANKLLDMTRHHLTNCQSQISEQPAFTNSKSFRKLGKYQGTLYETSRYVTIIDNWRTTEHLNVITDFFTEPVRIKCQFGDRLTPLQYWQTQGNQIMDKYYQETGKHTLNSDFDVKIIHEIMYQMGVKYCNNFRVSVALTVLKLFQPRKWLDFSSGWGDRLISAICYRNDQGQSLDQYVGIDPNLELHGYYRQIIDRLVLDDQDKTRFNMIENGFIEASDQLIANGSKFDLVFTSPPFFNLEKYSVSANDSLVKNPQVDQWYHQFLEKAIDRSVQLLADFGHLILYIDEVGKQTNYVDQLHAYLAKNMHMNMIDEGTFYYCDDYPRPFYVWRKAPTLLTPVDLKLKTWMIYFDDEILKTRLIDYMNGQGWTLVDYQEWVNHPIKLDFIYLHGSQIPPKYWQVPCQYKHSLLYDDKQCITNKCTLSLDDKIKNYIKPTWKLQDIIQDRDYGGRGRGRGRGMGAERGRGLTIVRAPIVHSGGDASDMQLGGVGGDKVFKYTEGIFIVRPCTRGAYSGKGIEMVTNLEEYKSTLRKLSKQEAIVSEYITNPLLFKGRKFHLRMYLYVSSNDAEKFKLWEIGKILTAEQPYQTGNYHNKEIHDTHMGSTDANYFYPQDLKQDNAQLDTDKLFAQMREICDVLEQIYRKRTKYTESDFGFEIFGLDFMIDDTLKVYLIEANDKVGFAAAQDNYDDEGYKQFAQQYYDWLYTSSTLNQITK